MQISPENTFDTRRRQTYVILNNQNAGFIFVVNVFGHVTRLSLARQEGDDDRNKLSIAIGNLHTQLGELVVPYANVRTVVPNPDEAATDGLQGVPHLGTMAVAMALVNITWPMMIVANESGMRHGTDDRTKVGYCDPEATKQVLLSSVRYYAILCKISRITTAN
jgi:hypothetical protein